MAITSRSEAKAKRGRPKKVNVEMEFLKDVISDMKENQKLQTKMMMEMLRVAQSNSDMVGNWFKMFAQPTSANQTSSLDQREMPPDEGWEPLSGDEVANLLGEETAKYFEQMVNT